jgi:hypothetical protein
MKKQKSKQSDYIRTNIYIKPIDLELFDWAKSQRQSLSEVIALALMDYRKKLQAEKLKS